MKKSKIWFLGLPLVPIYFAMPIIGFYLFHINKITIKMIIIISIFVAMSLWLITIIFNIHEKYTYHIKDFSLTGRIRCRRNGLSKDKLRAMYPSMDKAYKSKKRDGIIIGRKGGNYIRIPLKKSGRWLIQSILVIGGSRSGKSTAVLENTINNELCGHPVTVFAADLKGELYCNSIGVKNDHARVIGIGDQYDGWDPYFCITQESSDDDVLVLLNQIARSLISTQNEKDEFFVNQAVKLFEYIALYYYRKVSWISASGSVRSGFADAVTEMAAQDVAKHIKRICDDNEMQKKHPKIYENLSGFIADDSDTFKSIATQLQEKLEIFERDDIHRMFCAPVKASPMDLDDGISIYLAISQSKLTLYAPLINLIVSETIYYLMDRHNDNPIYLILDELPRYGKIDLLEHATSTLLGNNVGIVAIIQSLSQLKKIYGENDTLTIMDNCSITYVLSCRDVATGKVLSEWSPKYDEHKQSYRRNSLSHMTDNLENVSTERRPVLEMSDLMTLKESGEACVWIDGTYMRVEKLPYYADNEVYKFAVKNCKKNEEVQRIDDPLIFVDDYDDEGDRKDLENE